MSITSRRIDNLQAAHDRLRERVYGLELDLVPVIGPIRRTKPTPAPIDRGER